MYVKKYACEKAARGCGLDGGDRKTPAIEAKSRTGEQVRPVSDKFPASRNANEEVDRGVTPHCGMVETNAKPTRASTAPTAPTPADPESQSPAQIKEPRSHFRYRGIDVWRTQYCVCPIRPVVLQR